MKPIARTARAPGLILLLALGLAACENAKPPREFYDRTVADVSRTERAETIGDLFAAERAAGEQAGAFLVNKHLWAATLDTLAFLPVASTDPFSGVIATDWSVNPDAPGERMKVAAFVKGLKMEARSLKVAVYREVRDANGQWVSAPVSAATPRRLEDVILTRARQMRIEALEAGEG